MLSFCTYLEKIETDSMQGVAGPYLVALNAIESAARKAVHFDLSHANSEVLTDYYRALKDVVSAIEKLRDGIHHNQPQHLATGPDNVV